MCILRVNQNKPERKIIIKLFSAVLCCKQLLRSVAVDIGIGN